MEGAWYLICAAYLVIGCFYYVASLPRIVSFIMRMNKSYDFSPYMCALIILMLTLILVWPYYVMLDLKDELNDRDLG